ncbi:hypothetical protein CWC33_05970 [Idiomarina sp. X4]|uniref:hypothetical protein n=1 Tax=Idiomarina sp. X4 TaxID=2055892 RepID=UPI000C2912EA|nr:hypothetical protein [Idiomarina sp. X4]ATZ73270.1 hypothetical protein CWC33_05970 [Idiomarina sp. X4]
MPSHMGVQRFATSRNAQTETFVEFILELFCESLRQKNRVQNFQVESQKHFVSDIASDVWDHFVSYFDNYLNKEIEIWCQTTCYKGNANGKPEPNKTYEVRETLVEAISLREHILRSEKLARTVHFTVGSRKYTYNWFSPVKEKTFDKSIYLELTDTDIFEEIASCFEGACTELQVKENIKKHIENETELGLLIKDTCLKLMSWATTEKYSAQGNADSQYALVSSNLAKYEAKLESTVLKSKNAGVDIKKTCNDVVYGKESADPIINKTVDLLLEKKPFIKTAKSFLSNWHRFSDLIYQYEKSSRDLNDFVTSLWTAEKKVRLIARRLLMRVGARESINYVQDVDIEGITEHNLYSGNHDGYKLTAIITHVVSELPYTSTKTLASALTSREAKKLIQSAVWFEARNGTSLKPSFDYISLALESQNFIIQPANVLTDKPLGYHAQLAEQGEVVKPYSNLKVLLNSNGNLLAFLKGKYFNPPEFPRRCKEEAYVSLTLSHDYIDDVFNRSVDVPIIMFIDMPTKFSPPEYALKRLMAFGWRIAFNVDDILEIISEK